MKPQVLTATSIAQNGTTAWVPVDDYQTPFNLSLALVPSSGTWDVQYTYDNIFDTTVTPTAFTHSVITGKTTNTDGTITAPVRAIRLKQTGVSAGTTTLTILQGREP